MWWVILGHCYAFQVMTGLPSKLCHIFITNKLPKIYFRRRNNSSRQQLFQYFKGEKGLSCNPGSEECQCRYERGIVISSHWVAWPLLLQLQDGVVHSSVPQTSHLWSLIRDILGHYFNGVQPVFHKTVFLVIFTLFTVNSFTEVYMVDQRNVKQITH